MKALLKIEWIKTWRSWPVFIMGIGMPVGFFLLFFKLLSQHLILRLKKIFLAVLYVDHDWLFHV